jgi:hypothetical protein
MQRGLILIAKYIIVINLQSSTDRSVFVTSGRVSSGRKTAEAAINHATGPSPGHTHGHDTMLNELTMPLQCSLDRIYYGGTLVHVNQFKANNKPQETPSPSECPLYLSSSEECHLLVCDVV